LEKISLYKLLKKNAGIFHPVVSFDPLKDKIIHIDSSENNEALQSIDFTDTGALCKFTDDLLRQANAKFGLGGYNELRSIYSRSALFNNDLNNKSADDEPRRLHIGVDISGKEGTEIFAPCDGTVHSFADNNNFGDYGPTIILSHRFDNFSFYTLYGHLSLADLQNIKEGDGIKKGQKFAHFGSKEENGHWPPHLHFQVINDIGNYKGDYPGVCKFSEREIYLNNCPDPELILKMQE
jgi:murein DD-endopeptidase MepM/ murein hydrolase activator NlpD